MLYSPKSEGIPRRPPTYGPTDSPAAPDLARDQPPDLPRILCLHGGGSNATVFAKQFRAFIPHLASRFRLCFAEGPFECDPHPDLVVVYGQHPPYRRWLRWKGDHQTVDHLTASLQIKNTLLRAMRLDDEMGATGPWVGILGFSQGAKIAASVLYTQQRLVEEFGKDAAWTNFRFGVLMAGQGPLVVLDPGLKKLKGIAHAGDHSLLFNDWPEPGDTDHLLRLPTLHIQGLRDPGLKAHERLHDLYCKEGPAFKIQWPGDHRIPFRPVEAKFMAEEIIKLADRAESGSDGDGVALDPSP